MLSPEKSVEVRALDCLGRGFDLTNDFRLKFVKGNGAGGRRLVVVDDVNKRDMVFPDGAVVRGVSQDIRCDKGDRIRFKSDVLQFNQVFHFFPSLCSYVLCGISSLSSNFFNLISWVKFEIQSIKTKSWVEFDSRVKFRFSQNSVSMHMYHEVAFYLFTYSVFS